MPQAVSYPDTIVNERHRHSGNCFINPVTECDSNINTDRGFTNAHLTCRLRDEDFCSDSNAHIAGGYIDRSGYSNTHPNGCVIGDTIAYGNTGADVYADTYTITNTNSAAFELYEYR